MKKTRGESFTKPVREMRREEMRRRLQDGEPVSKIATEMNAGAATVYEVKKEMQRQQVVVSAGPDLMLYWVETVIYDQHKREISRIACPLPSHKVGLEIALKSKGLKLP